jgi:N-acetylglucosamine kinase-like BadF-type ATPase
MYLLAESGGTKTQWHLFDKEGIIASHRSSGMNPNVQGMEDMLAQQRGEWSPDFVVPEGTEVFFYGAGLGAKAAEQTVRDVLEDLFPGCELHLESDMLAAARAVAGEESAIVCILGTGSNCCWYDQGQIQSMRGSHGYLFNDEGSGTDLGRAIINAVLNHEIPQEEIELFNAWTGKDILDIRSEIYAAPKVNVALAEYSRFFAEYKHRPVLRIMASARFLTFVQRNVMRIDKYRELPIHFVGSVAEVYADVLYEAMGMLGLKPSKILAAPADALLEYHLAKLAKQ